MHARKAAVTEELQSGEKELLKPERPLSGAAARNFPIRPSTHPCTRAASQAASRRFLPAARCRPIRSLTPCWVTVTRALSEPRLLQR